MELPPPPDQDARRPAEAVAGAGDVVILATRLGLALAETAARLLSEAATPGALRRVPGPLGFGLGVAVGLGMAAELRVLAAAERVLVPSARVVARARRQLEPWYRRGRDEQRDSRELAERLWRLVLARVVSSALEQVDVNAIAERIDLERIVDRLDLDAIIERVDFARVARGVLESPDIDEVIRDSTQSLAGESVDALRRQGMTADRAVSRVVDRLLRRGRDGSRG